MVTSGSWCFSIRTILTGCSSTTVVSAVAIATDRSGYSLLTTLSWADIRDCMCEGGGGVCEGGGDSV